MGSATDLLTNIIQILVGGIKGVATGIGAGLSDLVNGIFIGPEGGLSAFGALVVIFAGISLAVGLCRWVVNFVTSLGARNR